MFAHANTQSAQSAVAQGILLYLFAHANTQSDADGRVSGSVEYDVFGKVVTETGVFAGSAGGSGGISALVFAYAGKPYDPVTGLSDYGFRDYAPTLARFTTVDPICAKRSCSRKSIVYVRSREHAIRDGSNWYAYCNSDPVNYVDMWGLTASDKGGNGNNGLYGERYHNGKYVMTVDVNNPEAFDAALSAYSGVRKYGAAGTTPVDSIALTDSSGQIIYTFSDEEAMLRYAESINPVENTLKNWWNKPEKEKLTTDEASLQSTIGIIEMVVGAIGGSALSVFDPSAFILGIYTMADGAIVYADSTKEQKKTPMVSIPETFLLPYVQTIDKKMTFPVGGTFIW